MDCRWQDGQDGVKEEISYMIREKEEELSLQGRLVRELMAKVTNEYLIGR